MIPKDTFVCNYLNSSVPSCLSLFCISNLSHQTDVPNTRVDRPKMVPGFPVPHDDELGTICGVAKLAPGKEYFPMVNDLYGGSGFEISGMVREERPEAQDRGAFVQQKVHEKLVKLGLAASKPSTTDGSRINAGQSK